MLSEDERTIFRSPEIDSWIALAENFERKDYRREKEISLEEKVDVCAYYFKECYADAMSIRLLGARVYDYLKAFTSEAKLISSCDDVEGVHLIQRLSIVLVACLEESVFSASGVESLEDIRTALAELYAGDLANKAYHCVRTLYSGVPNSQQDTWPPDKNIYYASRNALISVVDYLREVLRDVAKNEDMKRNTATEDPFFKIRDLYDSVICTSNFCGKRYYKEIIDYHKDIAEKVKKTKYSKAWE